MPFVTHFKSPAGEDLQIAAAELVTVKVPAAGSADKGDWERADGVSYYMQNTFTNATAACAVLQSCTDPRAIIDHGLRIEFNNHDWELRIDSLPDTACTLTLLFIQHSAEDTPCVLPALGVGGGTYYTVRIPAAGSENMYHWYYNSQGAGRYELQIYGVAWMKEDLFLELTSENAALFTVHNLKLYPDNGYLDFSLDSLPEYESVLYIYVPNAVNGGLLNGATQ